ncbi:MAG: branched-chain amino acid ABC transporter permease, partial [Mesorhizobium sp.]
VMLCVILLIRPNGLLGDRPRRPRFGKRAKAAAAKSSSGS